MMGINDRLSGLRYKGDFEEDLKKKTSESSKGHDEDSFKKFSEKKTKSNFNDKFKDQSLNKERPSLESIEINRLKRELPLPRESKKIRPPKFSKKYEFITLSCHAQDSRDSVKISARVKSEYLEAIKKIPNAERIKQGRGGLGESIAQLVEDWTFLRSHLRGSWEKIDHYLNRLLDSEKRLISLSGIGGEKELSAFKEYKERRENLITMAKTLGIYDYPILDRLRVYGIITPLQYENFIYLTRGNKRDDERLNGEGRVWN